MVDAGQFGGRQCTATAPKEKLKQLRPPPSPRTGSSRAALPVDLPRVDVHHEPEVYGSATGVFSSREIARELHEDVVFQLLTARGFRALHLKQLSDMFVQVVRLARAGTGQARHDRGGRHQG